jgi:hypothetical protein
MKRLLTTLVILTGLIGSGGAVWAGEWSKIDPSQSPIYFRSDLVKNYKGTGWNSNFSGKQYLIDAVHRTGTSGELYLEILAPGYFFETLPSTKGGLKYFLFLQNNFHFNGSVKVHQAQNIDIEYIFGERASDSGDRNRHCILFTSKSGDGSGDGQTSAGTQFLAGYFCYGQNVMKEEAGLLRMIDQIGFKTIGAPAPGGQRLREADRLVCINALKPNGTKWDTDLSKPYRFIAKAKSKGLTETSCAALLGR